ncbi:hypothetical protein [Dietzia cercidiphylli]|uniref:hypothetical protein n=1 Tax=Dietzia cercidiphylli TaxID=498199 RepID=UPI00223C1056|nr:hypothetical protein [Dietzia cercidiphylli]MCT1515305.1 hypothetical protein [Dietzia cercidiphylli]
MTEHAGGSVCSMTWSGIMVAGAGGAAATMLDHRSFAAAVIALLCLGVTAALAPAVRLMCERIPEEHGGPIPCDLRRLAPTAAVLAALGGAAVAWRWTESPLLLAAMMAFVIGGAWTVVIDMATERIPTALTWTYSTAVMAFLIAAGASGQLRWTQLAVAVACATVWSGLLLGLAIATRGWPGLGDVRLALPMGAITGAVSVSCAFYAAAGSQLLGLVAALVLLVHRRGALRSTMPMGPPMVVAAVLALALA